MRKIVELKKIGIWIMNTNINENDFNKMPYEIKEQSNESSNMNEINKYFKNHYNLWLKKKTIEDPLRFIMNLMD